MMQLFRANADLYETENEVVAKFDLPGVREDDIQVSIESGSLIVRVEKSGEREERRENAFLMERSFSGYYRNISLPPEADIDNVRADYDNGVLTVRFPIREGAGGQRAPMGAKGGRMRPTEIPVSRPAMSGSVTSGRGYPEGSAPFQQRLSRDDMLRQGTDSPLYRSGSGSYYSDSFDRPTGEAAPEAYFSEGVPTPVIRAAALSQREAEVARREAEVARREMAVARPMGSGSTTTGISMPEIPAPYQQRLSRDDMMRQGTDSPMYRSGSGSYYSDTFEKPTGDVAPQSSFGARSTSVERRRGSRVKGSPP